MATSRLEILKSMVAQNPGDSFARYGLAMEYRNAGDLETAAAEFRALLEANPDYGGAYFHYGQPCCAQAAGTKRAKSTAKASKSPGGWAALTREASWRERWSCWGNVR